ncbi:MAG: primosomal protein N' [Propionicimonas sp.]
MGEIQVARVAVDVPLANLDRPFDYRIPAELVDQAVVGARVRVRFAGRLRDGFILERPQTTQRNELSPLHAVVSPEPVLTPAVANLVREVADHYAGSFADVVRLAVPPRHGVTEKAEPPAYPAPGQGQAATVLAGYPTGSALLAALRDGRAPRAAWTVAPRPDGLGDWQAGFLEAAAATVESGRSALLLVPDAHDLSRLAERATRWFGAGCFVTLSAETGPAARYRAFLAASRGQVRLVLGTRSAGFAALPNLGLVALWDDGDDSWAEPRAPYPHAREVAVLRAHTARCALLLAAHSRTAEVQRLAERGWLTPLTLTPAQTRGACAVVRVASEGDRALERDPQARIARVPHDVFDTVRAALAMGPVLISVPRAGYHPVVACAGCREVAACPTCSQPLIESGRGQVTCRWCGPLPQAWSCRACGGHRLRTPVAGVKRTTQEFGMAFPGTRVVQSSAEVRIDTVDERPMIVLATPGTEPTARFGYAAAVLLDTAGMLRRPELRAGEEALRRWLAVTALVRPADEGGTVLVVGESSERGIQALVRLDPVGFAERELAERVEARFPPAVKLVTVDGDLAVLDEALAVLALPPAVDVQGPFVTPAASGGLGRITLRCSLQDGPPLVAAVRILLATRTASKADGVLRVRVDPQIV